MISLTFQVTPEGKLPVGVKETLARMIPEYAGKAMNMTFGLAKKGSSNSQREYYFAVIVPAWQKILHEASDHHWDKDDTHHYLMTEVGGWLKEPVMIHGMKYTRRRSYNDLTTIEAERHHALCRAKAAEEGYDIQEPNEMEESHA